MAVRDGWTIENPVEEKQGWSVETPVVVKDGWSVETPKAEKVVDLSYMTGPGNLGNPTIPTGTPNLSWTPPGMIGGETAIRTPYPKEVEPIQRDLTPEEDIAIGKRAEALAQSEFIRTHPKAYKAEE